MEFGWKSALAICLVLLLAAAPARADETAGESKPVVEEILDILRSRNQISEQEHTELLERARGEDEAAQAVAAQAAETSAEVAPLLEEDTFRAYWKRGLRMETSDGNFEMAIGGRMLLDAGIIGPSQVIQDEFDIDSSESGIRFRSARLYLKGTVYENFDFKFQYDFAEGVAGFKDVYIGANNVPFLQRIQIGHFKEPFSLEQLTSRTALTFMERSLQAPFEAARNTGVGVFTTFLDKRMTFAAGAFRIVDDLGDGFGSNFPYSIAARATGLPWYEEDGERLLHIGFSYAFNSYDDEPVRFRQRPSTGFGPRLVDTGEFAMDHFNALNPELALVLGPLSLQAEYLQTLAKTPEVSDPEFFGWYVEASYFLTGESRPYDTRKGVFGRIQPKRDFNWGDGSGWGAWQVGARWSQLNLNSGGIGGGRLQDLTLGLNWYLNPVMRVMFNYVYGDRSSPSGSENVYQMRFQIAL